MITRLLYRLKRKCFTVPKHETKTKRDATKDLELIVKTSSVSGNTIGKDRESAHFASTKRVDKVVCGKTFGSDRESSSNFVACSRCSEDDSGTNRKSREGSCYQLSWRGKYTTCGSKNTNCGETVTDMSGGSRGRMKLGVSPSYGGEETKCSGNSKRAIVSREKSRDWLQNGTDPSNYPHRNKVERPLKQYATSHRSPTGSSQSHEYLEEMERKLSGGQNTRRYDSAGENRVYGNRSWYTGEEIQSRDRRGNEGDGHRRQFSQVEIQSEDRNAYNPCYMCRLIAHYEALRTHTIDGSGDLGNAEVHRTSPRLTRTPFTMRSQVLERPRREFLPETSDSSRDFTRYSYHCCRRGSIGNGNFSRRCTKEPFTRCPKEPFTRCVYDPFTLPRRRSFWMVVMGRQAYYALVTYWRRLVHLVRVAHRH